MHQVNLDTKYQMMYDEFTRFKSKNKAYNNNLDKNLSKVKKELDDLKYAGLFNKKNSI